MLFGRSLQRTPGATEAQYLLAAYAFETLGYRRLEWKCNALNAPSRRAAQRLGFTFEGVFRQHMVVKGRNRDTAWFSMLDTEWSLRKGAFERWLGSENFDAEGRQRESLEVCEYKRIHNRLSMLIVSPLVDTGYSRGIIGHVKGCARTLVKRHTTGALLRETQFR